MNSREFKIHIQEKVRKMHEEADRAVGQEPAPKKAASAEAARKKQAFNNLNYLAVDDTE